MLCPQWTRVAGQSGKQVAHLRLATWGDIFDSLPMLGDARQLESVTVTERSGSSVKWVGMASAGTVEMPPVGNGCVIRGSEPGTRTAMHRLKLLHFAPGRTIDCAGALPFNVNGVVSHATDRSLPV